MSYKVWNYTFFGFLIVFISVTANAHILENGGVYKIENKADNGVLSLNNSDSSSLGAILAKWNDLGEQKWRAKQPEFAKVFKSKAYEFKPTSNDEDHLDVESDTLKVLASTSDGKTKYWKIQDVGEGVKQIRNYELGVCLASQGLDKPLTLIVCDNSNQTQWNFTKL